MWPISIILAHRKALINSSNLTTKKARGAGLNNNDSRGETHSFLVNQYRDALRKGEDIVAKSYLIAAKCFLVNDPIVNRDVYSLSKSDSDMSSAAKCVATVLNSLFDKESRTIDTEDASRAFEKMKSEMDTFVDELESYHLNLRTVQPSEISSGRILPRLSIDDSRPHGRESFIRSDTVVQSSARSLFFERLYDNLTESTRKFILENYLRSCSDPFLLCKLMMLKLHLSIDNTDSSSGTLLQTLLDLSKPVNEIDATSSPNVSRYAKSLLVMDCIPLILKKNSKIVPSVRYEDLLDRVLAFYSEHCLEESATDLRPRDLHEDLKKSIAARILGTEELINRQLIEDQVDSTIDMLSLRYLESFDDGDVKDGLEKIHSLVTKRDLNGSRVKKMLEIIYEIGLQEDIPQDILRGTIKDEKTDVSNLNTVARTKGRPKRLQQPIVTNIEQGGEKQLQAKFKEIEFVFYLIIRVMFSNFALYLRKSRSRILVNFNNANLLAKFETSVQKDSGSRGASTRLKASQDNSNKRIKLDPDIIPTHIQLLKLTSDSPLNSEQSKQMDKQIISALDEALQCYNFLDSGYGVFTKLWQKFLASNNCIKLNWYKRFVADSMLISGRFEVALETMNLAGITDASTNEEVDQEREKGDIGEVTDIKCPELNENRACRTTNLRHLVQTLSCRIQLGQRCEVLQTIKELLKELELCNLLVSSDSQKEDNIIDEYMVKVNCGSGEDTGFLFFDSLSIVRYCVDFLRAVMKIYISSPSRANDTAIGHAIVLTQLDWPKEAHVLDHCLAWIQANKPKSTTAQCLSAATKFTYPCFFKYIFHPCIIEEFHALLGQGYTLDIKANMVSNSSSATNSQVRGGQSSQCSAVSTSSRSSSNSTRAGKAMTTRGVNKSFKEDLKVAMTRQMKMSAAVIPLELLAEFISTFVISFLTDEK